MTGFRRQASSLARLAALVLVCGLALPALRAGADPLADAKAAGWVGERTDGFLGFVREGAPEPVRRLVADVNAQRRERYGAIAEKNGTTVVAVAALAARKLRERGSDGDWFQDDAGRWQRK